MAGLLSARKLQSGQQNFRSAFKFTMNVKMQQKRTAWKFSAVLLHTFVFVREYPGCRRHLPGTHLCGTAKNKGAVSVRCATFYVLYEA